MKMYLMETICKTGTSLLGNLTQMFTLKKKQTLISDDLTKDMLIFCPVFYFFPLLFPN